MRCSKALIIPLMCMSVSAFANDYPTTDRVFYAVHCMQDLGGQTMETFYSCTCRIDAIAEQLPFEDYDLGITYERHRRMTGEKGSVVRDNKLAKAAFSKLTEARKAAEEKCPVIKRVKRFDEL